MRKAQLVILYLIAASAIFGAGWESSTLYRQKAKAYSIRKVQASGYRYTSPLLDVELPEGLTINFEPVPFKYKVEDFVRKQTDGVMIRKVAVYYRDLLDGPWFGINEDQKFNPASMMKVPVMIAWLKRAEKKPAVLSQSFVYAGDEDLSLFQVHKPRHTLQKGRKYSVNELLVFMLKYSDNNATKILYENLTSDELNNVVDGMDVNNHPVDDQNSVTVHGYSGFFRILYNAAYLNRDMSEKALQLLAEQDFPEGIEAGVRPGTVVAAKFGEFEEGERKERKQLHEFGIVYSPRGHYIIGVMTEGSSFDRQTQVIRDISAMISSGVESSRNVRDH